MAWGTLKEVGWVNAFTSGKYATDNYVKYQIDESSRKLRVLVTRQRVSSLNSAYSYSGSVNNGCQFLGGVKDSQYPGGYDTEDTISVSGGGSTLIPSNSERTIGRVYTYNHDGSVPSITLSTQMIFDLPGYDPNIYGFSQQNWKSQNLQSKFPTIAKAINPVTDLQVTKITDTSISISFTGSEGAVKYKIWIEEDGTTNLNELETTDTKVTITNLSPGSSYNIGVCAVDSNGIESGWVLIDEITTLVQSVTTLEQATTLINVDDNAKIGFVYANVSGTVKKAMNIYVNVNGTAKKCIKKQRG